MSVLSLLGSAQLLAAHSGSQSSRQSAPRPEEPVAAFVHAFEERGLGAAPFTFINCIDNGGKLNLTTCHFCGTAIRYEYWIRSADGKERRVGCDCIQKSGDLGLIDIAKREEKRRREAARHAKFAREQEERNRQHEAVLQAQRVRNGGLTDSEKEAAERADERAVIKAANQWAIDMLLPYRFESPFCADMCRELERTPIYRLSYRQQTVITEILARQSGRRNSKAYEKARIGLLDRIEAMSAKAVQ